MTVSQSISGYAFLNTGTPITGANVDYYAAVAGTPTVSLGSTTTNTNGFWTFTVSTVGPFDVRIRWNSNNEVRWIKGLSVVGTSIPVRKTAAETVNNSTTLQNDDDFVLAVNASEDWIFRIVLFVDTNTTADFKVAFTAPTNGTLIWGCTHGNVTTATSVEQDYITVSGTALAVSGGTTNEFIVLEGSLRVDTTAGNLTLQWAQNTADVSDTTVRSGSYAIYQRTL